MELGGSGSAQLLWSLGWRLVAALLVLKWAWGAAEWVWFRPRRLDRLLRSQGLEGTRYQFLFGDLRDGAKLTREAQLKPLPLLCHDIAPRVVPDLHRQIAQHGKMSLSWFGPNPRVNIVDPELIREVLSTKFGHFKKPKVNLLAKYLASGLLHYDDEKWATHRKIINPAFHLEKLKRMMLSFTTCCDELIDRWEEFVGSKSSFELDVWPELQRFTGDVISRTAFGSSYKEGRRIFQLLAEQSELLVRDVQKLFIPGYRFIPTKNNRQREEIRREAGVLLKNMIEHRERAIEKGEGGNDDLLGLLMESNLSRSREQGDSKLMTTEDVIEECKLFYFAGQETTSILLTWTMVLLSMHPSWQARAREEVLQVFGKSKPDYDGLSRLKIVNMVLYEVLRLYPPVIYLLRETYKEMKLGKISVPPGVQLLLPILFVHNNPEFWGDDASEFRPERFTEGISKVSKNQVIFFPFSWGPRICIGQSFALLEAKIGLARILQHFSWEISASYTHAPHMILTLRPQHGAQIILHKI